MPRLSYDIASGNEYLYKGKEYNSSLQLYNPSLEVYDPVVAKLAVPANPQYNGSPYTPYNGNPTGVDKKKPRKRKAPKGPKFPYDHGGKPQPYRGSHGDKDDGEDFPSGGRYWKPIRPQVEEVLALEEMEHQHQSHHYIKMNALPVQRTLSRSKILSSNQSQSLNNRNL